MPSDEAKFRLSYHPTAGERQRRMYESNRELYMSVYDYVSNVGEPSREKSLALTALQESLMWLNCHVACNGVGAEDGVS